MRSSRDEIHGRKRGARQASLRRLSQFGIVPKHSLGQNFLIDDNILRVTARMAELGPQDVVLEVGAGLGTLTEHVASIVGFVHAFEVDGDLRAALDEAVGARDNVRLAFEDAVTAPLSELDPAPNKLVANLPYSVAVPVLARCVVELPRVDLACIMVQREIAERLAARPGSKVYGVPSAVVQMAFNVDAVRPVSPSVFVPRPRVLSALVRMSRWRAFPDPRLRDFVAAAFSHRRKTLAASLSLAMACFEARPGELEPPPGTDVNAVSLRERVRKELARLGLPADVRAEALSPSEIETLWRALYGLPPRALSRARAPDARRSAK